MNIKIYRLTFKSALHLADVRQDYGSSETRLHSDTLHAAIISVLNFIGASFPYEGKVDFAISSLYPFRINNDESFNYFFPKPHLRFNTTFENKLLVKKMKKVKWLDKNSFEKLIAGKKFDNFGNDLEKMNDFQGDFLSIQHYKTPLMTFQTLPRVKVPRDYQPDKLGNILNPEPFYMQQIRFTEGAGLYFMTSGNTELLDKAMNILQFEGIGTDRYLGNGHFTYDKSNITLEIPEDGDYMTNLSLFCPENEQQLIGLLKGQGAYDLIKRGGWVTSDAGLGLRKKSVFMFLEGSIFRNVNNSLDVPYTIGNQYINLTPDNSILPEEKKAIHPIWRNGQSLFIPVKL